MRSRLYRGTVWHARGEPRYTFQYRVWYICLDLSEVEQVASRLRLFGHNRPRVLSLWDADYLRLQQAQQPAAGERIELLTMPRFLGHAFNPVSFFLHRREDAITHVAAEVHNTWGERHVYELVRAGDGPTTYHSEVDKAFYVSPFLPMEARYGFHLSEEGDGRLRMRIESFDEVGERLFSSGIDVQPVALSDANLARVALTVPLVTLKTVAMIHWQGLKLWLKGVEFRRNPSREGRRRQSWLKGH